MSRIMCLNWKEQQDELVGVYKWCEGKVHGKIPTTFLSTLLLYDTYTGILCGPNIPFVQKVKLS